MVRKDERGVVIAAPLQFNDPATVGLPRLDDPHRGPAVTDAYDLSRCRIDLLERSRSWQPPEELPIRLRAEAARIAENRRSDWLQLQWASQRVDHLISNAIRTGELPIWVAPTEGDERPVAPSAMIEVDEATIAAGCYLPIHDSNSWLAGRPLFVKKDDWVNFVASKDRDMTQPIEASSANSGGLVTSTAGAEKECQEWLKNGFADDHKNRRSKSQFQSGAQAIFGPRLSVRGFLRAWDAVAPQAGRSKPGRKS